MMLNLLVRDVVVRMTVAEKKEKSEASRGLQLSKQKRRKTKGKMDDTQLAV
jgi:hypothetical protein